LLTEPVASDSTFSNPKDLSRKNIHIKVYPSTVHFTVSNNLLAFGISVSVMLIPVLASKSWKQTTAFISQQHSASSSPSMSTIFSSSANKTKIAIESFNSTSRLKILVFPKRSSASTSLVTRMSPSQSIKAATSIVCSLVFKCRIRHQQKPLLIIPFLFSRR